MKQFTRKFMTAAATAASSFLLAACAANDGTVTVHPIQDNLQPRVMQKTLFNAPDELMTGLGLEDGVPASVSVFLIETDGMQILFDAANGAPDSQLIPALNSLEIAPDDIDYVFITHLHGDHFGGLATKRADDSRAATFRNAVVMIPQAEYDYWMSMPQEQTERLRNTLGLYGDRVKTFSYDEKLPCGIKAVPAEGHTPGHTAYRIEDILIAGDIMHGVALQLEHPEYSARYDIDSEKAVQTRRTLIDLAKAEGLTMYGMHFPAPYHLKFD